MKKIININLSGRVIPIEDAAYEKLQVYIESLRRYFANEEGRDEIINDIEGRIAELLHEKIRKGASAVTDADIDQIIASMGKPEDFDADVAEGEPLKQSSQEQYTHTEKRRKGRLYRDSSDKILGGVCSGIAAYLNVDPAIVRILFAIITFGGFGLGILAYIVLWIVLPPKDIEGFAGKRLFRNPDDRIIGGVAGGLAAYFNKSSTTIRIIFALPLIANIIFGILNGVFYENQRELFYFPNIFFGSFTSTFIVIYIILWIVLPEASSHYDKMEMRGEKVDVNTIRQNVKEGADSMKERMNTWSQEVKESAQNLGDRAKQFTNTQGKAFAKDFTETARTGSSGLGHAIGVLFKVFFLFIAGTIAFALFVALIALIFGGIAWWPVNDFLWTSKWQKFYAWGTLLFFIVVPLVAFITWVIRRLLRVRSRHSYLGWIFGFLWTIGWVAAILFAASIAKDFRSRANTPEAVLIQQPPGGRLIVAVSQPELQYNGNFGWMNEGSDDEGWDLSNDTLKLSTVKFNIIPSTDSLYHVVLRRQSFGRSREDAEKRASQIQYSITSRDSVLDLANGYAIGKESKFRGQQVEVEIAVPIGKSIRFDESVNDKLNPTDVKVKRRYRRNGVHVEINDSYWHQFKPGVDYVMGLDGRLTDTLGKTVIEDYRYPENDSIRIQRAIEQKKQEIKDLEDIQKPLQQRDRSFIKKPKKIKTEIEGSVANNSSPIISLVSWF